MTGIYDRGGGRFLGLFSKKKKKIDLFFGFYGTYLHTMLLYINMRLRYVPYVS